MAPALFVKNQDMYGLRQQGVQGKERKDMGKCFTPTEEDNQGDTCSPSGTITTGNKGIASASIH